jgi:hypothetical protein
LPITILKYSADPIIPDGRIGWLITIIIFILIAIVGILGFFCYRKKKNVDKAFFDLKKGKNFA